MSTPLYEQERLGSYSQNGAYDDLPLGRPTRSCRHQGLFLTTDGDALIGRAENGGSTS